MRAPLLFLRVLMMGCVLVLAGCEAPKPMDGRLQTDGNIAVETVKVADDIDVWLVEDHTVPMVALEIRFLGGSVEDPKGQEGRAAMMAALLSEGAGAWDDEAFALRLEDLQMGISAAAGEDSVRVSARMLSKNLEPGFEVLQAVLRDPRFDEEALRRIRDRALLGLKDRETDPGWLAETALKAATFPDSPYARTITQESLMGIGRDEVLAAHAHHLTRGRMQITVVGAIGRQHLENLIEAYLLDVPKAGAAPEPATLAVDPANRVLKRTLPQPQTRLSYVAPAVALKHDDFFPLYLAAHILGSGDFSSRLMQSLRVEKGLTYGVGLQLMHYKGGGMLMGGTLTQNARADDALRAFRHELHHLADQGVTAEELDDAKRYLTGSFVLGFDGSSAMASRLAGFRAQGRESDYVNRRNQIIHEVTLADVNRVAAQYFHPSQFTVVAVGIPSGIKANQVFATSKADLKKVAP